LSSEGIVTRLKILTFIPLGILAIIFFYFALDALDRVRTLQSLQERMQHIENISRLITKLQRERGLSSGYLESGGAKFAAELAQARVAVDRESSFPWLRKDIAALRAEIDGRKLPASRSFLRYSALIRELQSRYMSVIRHMDDPILLNASYAYLNLSYVKEALGQIRGTFNGIFSAKGPVDSKLPLIALRAFGVLETSLERFNAFAPKQYAQALRDVIDTEEYRYIRKMTAEYLTHTSSPIKEDSGRWFGLSSQVIDRIAELARNLLEENSRYAKGRIDWIRLQILMQFSALVFIFIAFAWLGRRIKDTILRNITLLGQYKDAVDRSSIVSKTDVGGRITYANNKFCEISGYSREELVGKSHNIVRHPEVPKSVFKEMWETILEKKPWNGIVKNRKKNGEYYVVEATINPILNHKGEIEEFIAIRNDITEVIKLHEELERTQEELILKMGEIGEARSQETGQHVIRVAKYSELLGRYYGLSREEIKLLTVAWPMHDIEKVAFPDMILKKTGRLTPKEWKIMQTHSEIGYALFKDSDKPLLQAAAVIAHEHHEKFDGSGYPRGLRGEQIHIFGRITALADVFDALGSDRYYKKAWSDEKIFSYIKEERGKYFDPVLVDIFFEHLEEFLAIRNRFCDSGSR